jgi:hypothetical protein
VTDPYAGYIEKINELNSTFAQYAATNNDPDSLMGCASILVGGLHQLHDAYGFPFMTDVENKGVLFQAVGGIVQWAGENVSHVDMRERILQQIANSIAAYGLYGEKRLKEVAIEQFMEGSTPQEREEKRWLRRAYEELASYMGITITFPIKARAERAPDIKGGGRVQ